MPDPNELLVESIRESLAGTYDVLGFVGTDGNGAQILLARDVATESLVGVVVAPNADDPTEFLVEIEPTLGKTVTVPGSMCPECSTALPELDAFCFHCGANLSGSTARAGTPDSEVVLEALAMATEGRYEVLGRLDREGNSGAVYFARDLITDQIAALRLKRIDVVDAVQPEYVQRLRHIFNTGELPAAAAERKAQEDAERIAAERVAAERAAAERVAAERAAAERAAAERAASERAAAERAAAERAAAERAAAARAESERIAAESAAAAAAAYTPPAIAEFSLPQETAPDFTPPAFKSQHAPVAISEEIPAPAQSRSSRLPLIGVAVVALLAVGGYFAFRGGGDKTSGVASAPTAADSAAIPAVATVVAPPVTDSAPPATTPAATDSAAATTAAAPTATDSGTIRIGEIPADARVTVDGRTVRGRVLRVTARSHQLAVSAKGFQPYSERLTVASGATVRWTPKLVAVVAANTPATNAPAPPPPANVTTKKSCRDLVRAEDWSGAHDTCVTEANAGNSFAAASLGRMYAQGQGVTRDANESMNWYRKAATAGDHDAQVAMGYALRDGKGVKRDEKASADMFKLAAEAGEKAGQLEYAVALEKGDGVAKNQAAARDWYRKAADQGVFMAARRLGRMLEKGDGGPKSEPDALAAYEKAATLGDAESAMTVGKWYRDGRGAAQSPAQALTWFKKALELGNKDAANEIKKLQK